MLRRFHELEHEPVELLRLFGDERGIILVVHAVLQALGISGNERERRLDVVRDACDRKFVLLYRPRVRDLLFESADAELFEPAQYLPLLGGTVRLYRRGEIAGVQRVDCRLHIVLPASQSCHL